MFSPFPQPFDESILGGKSLDDGLTTTALKPRNKFLEWDAESQKMKPRVSRL